MPESPDFERGQWEVIPGWGVRNVFNRAAIEFRAVNLSPEEARAFIQRVQRLLNADAKRHTDA
jgi:hypothetical protein